MRQGMLHLGHGLPLSRPPEGISPLGGSPLSRPRCSKSMPNTPNVEQFPATAIPQGQGVANKPKAVMATAA